jgi:mannose-1-phosphate guanylyltransferase
MKVQPVVMAGGNGKRLWPLSSKDKPKQFTKIVGELTLLQETLNRNKFLGKPTIITSEKYELITKKQAAEINVEIELITEPLQKNTAVCAIITALSAKAQGFDTVVLLPSDHHIMDNINYFNTINKALHYVNEFGICTIGIPINAISADYGYINTGLSIAENIYLVDHFIEKPILEQAKKYFQSNKYFWNSGIFVYDINFFLNLAMNLQPDLFCIAEKAFNTVVKNEKSLAIDDEAYNEIEAISIDNAVMEYISGMVMIKADFAWNDLGTWHSLLQVKHQNINDNYCEGNVVTSNTTNSFISSNNKLTTVVGLDNVIIIDTMNGLLVADKSKMNEIKELVMKIEQN